MGDYLLDTHVVLWLATDPQQIPEGLRTELERANALFVSAISAYELGQKVRHGRLPGAAGLLERWDSLLDRLMAEELPVSSKDALLAARLDWEHRDPFDRLLVAQAQVGGLRLVSKDSRILNFPQAACLAWA